MVAIFGGAAAAVFGSAKLRSLEHWRAWQSWHEGPWKRFLWLLVAAAAVIGAALSLAVSTAVTFLASLDQASVPTSLGSGIGAGAITSLAFKWLFTALPDKVGEASGSARSRMAIWFLEGYSHEVRVQVQLWVQQNLRSLEDIHSTLTELSSAADRAYRSNHRQMKDYEETVRSVAAAIKHRKIPTSQDAAADGRSLVVDITLKAPVRRLELDSINQSRVGSN